MLLVIDNYDSFVFNLARYAQEIGYETKVLRNDAINVEQIRTLAPEAIILSPGPCDPERAGICLDVVRKLGSSVPILGVCLGHQVIAAAYGARIVRGEPVHGRTSWVHHDGCGIFAGLPTPFEAARYHSLVVPPPSVPKSLEITAALADGTIMALRHRQHRVVGVQFHPESVLTRQGHQLLANFLTHFNGQSQEAASALVDTAAEAS